jgi:diketogulonate reductase-like aldo/keto reductase
LSPRALEALQAREMITRAIPSTGERLPVVGLGGANTFSEVARDEDFDAIGGVLQALVDGGGRLFDTAAGYGASEEVSGRVADDLGVADRIFWATKVNVAGGRGGGGAANPAAVHAQIDRSFERLRVPVIDLIQVHNMGDPPTQIGVLKDLKAAGRIRYIGITTTSENQYAALERVMRAEPLDFIGIDYAVDNRVAESVILPLAQERGIGVLVYLPFGRSRIIFTPWAKCPPGMRGIKRPLRHTRISCASRATLTTTGALGSGVLSTFSSISARAAGSTSPAAPLLPKLSSNWSATVRSSR